MTTLRKSADLLDVLVANGGSMRLSDLADALDTPKSSLHRLCGALVEIGVLRRDDTGVYDMGPRLISWGLAADLSADIAAIAQPFLQRVHELIGETVGMHVPGGLDRICIATIPGRFALVNSLHVGMHNPLGFGASGKVLLAYATSTMREASRQALADAGSPVPSDEELAEVRRERWATSVDEHEVGMSAGATPVHGRQGNVIAVVSVGGPTARLGARGLDAARGPLQDCAASITAALA